MKTLRLLTVILIVGLISGLQAVQAKSKQYTTVNAPCAGSLPGQGTWPVGINQKGDIVGGCQDITGRVFHGFLLHQGKYTTLTAPKAGRESGRGTWPSDINQKGDVVGFYEDSNGKTHGFVWH